MSVRVQCVSKTVELLHLLATVAVVPGTTRIRGSHAGGERDWNRVMRVSQLLSCRFLDVLPWCQCRRLWITREWILMCDFGGSEEARTQWMQGVEREIDPTSDRTRSLSHDDLGSSLDSELVFDVVDPFTAGVCDGEWCGLLHAERTIRWMDTRLSWLEMRASLSVLSEMGPKVDATEELLFRKPCFVSGTRQVSFHVGLDFLRGFTSVSSSAEMECTQLGVSMVLEEILEETASGICRVYFAGGRGSCQD